MTSTAEGSSVRGGDDDPSDRTTMPLDAVANLRLLGEVQRRGLEAAELVIARLTDRTNAASRHSAHADGTDAMAAMTEVFAESVSATMAALTSGAGAPPPSSTRHAGRPGSPEVLRARGVPGAQVDVELWMHNYTDELAIGVEIHLGELIGAHGERLSPSCVGLRPEHPFDLTASSSRSVQLTIDLPPGTPAGRYRGILTAAHLADLWLVLEVDVDESPAGPVSAGDAPAPSPAAPAS